MTHREGIDIQERGIQNNLGIVLRSTGRQEEAEHAFGEAVALLTPLASEFPAVPQLSPAPGRQFVVAAVRVNSSPSFHDTM
jgi:hypothetical protein